MFYLFNNLCTMKINVRCLYVIFSMLCLNQVVCGDVFSWLRAFFKEDNIVLNEKLRNYFFQNLEQQDDYETQKVFSLKGVTTEEACTSCINQLLSFSKDDLKQLLCTIYTEGYCPKNKNSLTVLITLLSMVMKIKITGKVDTKKEGTYTITYTVEDAAGNKSTVTRTVIVE